MRKGTNSNSAIVMHPDAIAATLRGADLRTYQHWIYACKALLADKPSDAALTDSEETGYIMLHHGELIAIPAPTPGVQPSRSPSVRLSSDAWDYVNECWQGLSKAESDVLLTQPVFKRIQLTK